MFDRKPFNTAMRNAKTCFVGLAALVDLVKQSLACEGTDSPSLTPQQCSAIADLHRVCKKLQTDPLGELPDRNAIVMCATVANQLQQRTEHRQKAEERDAGAKRKVIRTTTAQHVIDVLGSRASCQIGAGHNPAHLNKNGKPKKASYAAWEVQAMALVKGIREYRKEVLAHFEDIESHLPVHREPKQASENPRPTIRATKKAMEALAAKFNVDVEAIAVALKEAEERERAALSAAAASAA